MGSVAMSSSSQQMSQGASEQAAAAEQAGNLINVIVPNIKRTAALVQEISAASMEQDSGAEQISKAIQRLDQIIQQNAAAAEEMASTSEELSGQAEQMQEMMAYFKLDQNATSVSEEKLSHARLLADSSFQSSPRNGSRGASLGLTLNRSEQGGRVNTDDLDHNFEQY